MAITHDADSNKIVNGFAASPTETWTHTTAANQTLLVVSAMIWQDVAGTGTISSATYNGVAMTKAIQSRTGGMNSEIWYLVNPASGANTVSVVVSGNIDAFKAGASTYAGTDTSSVLGNTANGGTTGTASVAITTSTDNSIIIDSLSYFGTNAQTLGGSQTQIYKDSTGSTGGGASYRITTTAGSYTNTWTNAGSGDVKLTIAEFKPAAAVTNTGNFFSIF